MHIVPGPIDSLNTRKGLAWIPRGNGGPAYVSQSLQQLCRKGVQIRQDDNGEGYEQQCDTLTKIPKIARSRRRTRRTNVGYLRGHWSDVGMFILL